MGDNKRLSATVGGIYEIVRRAILHFGWPLIQIQCF